jgi:broad specificity phosphatase PhoE
MTSFWLVRHGQTDWNLTGRWQGQSPEAPPLNENGRAQVLALGSQLKDLSISAIYASDLLRTQQTAELLAKPLGLQVILEPRLREMNLGEWEGMYSDEIETRFPRELAKRARDPVHTPAPGGESPAQMVTRVLAAANHIEMRHCGETVMLVAHGVSLAILTCISQGIPMERVYDYVPENAKLLRVEWKPPHQANEFSRWKDHRKNILLVQDEA